MRIEITERSLELTDTMREHIEKRVLKFRKFYEGVLACHVFASLERFIYKFEITVHGTGFDLFAEAHAEDLHAAFESAGDKMERQVKKLKDKIRRRRMRKPEVAMTSEEGAEELEDMSEEFEGA
jgi:putative sigma-54 modulation protein